MKRHPAIQPLSRDHYVGLTLAMRLKRGRPENIRSNWPSNDDPKAQATRAKEIFNNDLFFHFKEEEDILFKRVRPFLESNKGIEVLELILRQHNEFYGLFEIIETGSFEKIQKRLEYTGNLLEEHVRIEERELFGYIEKFTPIEILQEIEPKINKRSRFDCSTLL